MHDFLVLVQARTGSSRFPGKVLKEVCGKPVLIHQLERISGCKHEVKIVVITSENANDDVIVDLCEQYNYLVVRGSEEDVLARHFKAAKYFGYNWIIKIPSDCPLIDPNIIDLVIDDFINLGADFDYFSNLHPATFPDGNDVEIMSYKALKRAFQEAQKPLEREHTTPFFWENPNQFKIGNYVWQTGLDYSMSHRFTLDYPEDLEFIMQVYENLFNTNPLFSLEDILKLLKDQPEIFELNKKLAGVNWYRNHLGELKTIHKNSTKDHE